MQLSVEAPDLRLLTGNTTQMFHFWPTNCSWVVFACVTLNPRASHQQPPPALLPLTPPLIKKKKDPPDALPPRPLLLWLEVGISMASAADLHPLPTLSQPLWLQLRKYSRAQITVCLPLMFHCKHRRGTKLLEACCSTFLWVITHIFLLRLSLTDDQGPEQSVTCYQSAQTLLSGYNKRGCLVMRTALKLVCGLEPPFLVFYHFQVTLLRRQNSLCTEPILLLMA